MRPSIIIAPLSRPARINRSPPTHHLPSGMDARSTMFQSCGPFVRKGLEWNVPLLGTANTPFQSPPP
ncbi:MAG TPA: hypothetical protein H9825_10175 [Candidatus Sphingobacterium stercorigallinarum]|nr:hypothetical protein [Candidatus Sphingobacterium stercorigallinarum]